MRPVTPSWMSCSGKDADELKTAQSVEDLAALVRSLQGQVADLTEKLAAQK